MADDARRRVTRRSLLAGLGGIGGGAALTTASAWTPAQAQEPGDTAAQVVAEGLGKQQDPRWTVERSIPCRTPGHAQWIAEPGLDAGSLWLGDSTFEFNRTPYQYAQELARRNPGIRVVYDKANWGGFGDSVSTPTTTATSDFAVFRSGDPTGSYSQILNAASWAAAGGRDVRQPLPGIKNFSLQLPPNPAYTPWGANAKGSSLTRGAVGVDLAPVTWLPGANAVALVTQDSGVPDGRGTVLRLKPDGTVELRLALDGAGTRVLAAVTTKRVVDVVPDGSRCAVLFEFDLDKGGRSIFTPYYRTGGHGDRWRPFGDKITLNKQTGAWRGNPLVGWEIGGGGTFRGDVFEAIVRKVDRSGPDLLPRLPQQWSPSTVNMRGTLQGGRTYWMTVLAWPQHGLLDFVERSDVNAEGKGVFNRAWNKDLPSKANVVSPMDMVPQLPYLMTVLNSGHNDTSNGSLNPQLLRGVHDRLTARTSEAEHCVLVQNATLRADTSDYRRPDGSFAFDQANTTGQRRGHDWRIAQYAAVARTLGCEVLDGRSDMVDYVRAGGNIADLLQTTGERLHPTAIGGQLIALGLLNQTTTTAFGTTGVLP